ncbi:MAG TPA: hypothetical protein VG986_12635, partial [Pseudolabrys sp.]|nr:hypothetical protein [Pseudolabrys sp.]
HSIMVDGDRASAFDPGKRCKRPRLRFIERVPVPNETAPSNTPPFADKRFGKCSAVELEWQS